MGSKEINVIKRNGEKEALNYEKINQVLIWATEGIAGVSASSIAMNAQIQMHDGITTNDIHKILIKSSAELITEKEPNYQYVTSKLVNYLLRKEVFNTYNNFPRLKDLIKENIKEGVYDKEILDTYDDRELDKLEGYIKHERDEELTYAGIQQLIDKYLIRHREKEVYYETPQFMYMVIAMVVYSDMTDKVERRKNIKELYDMLSQHEISLPTPILAGIRTPNRQFSSCVLIDVADDLESIGASNHAVLRYISNRAGIGLNMRLRGIGSSVNNGEKIHTGIVPFLKMFEAAVKSCSQGGIRGGAATTYYPFFHYEIESIISLKNGKGNELNRARRLDHAVQFCRLFYKRFVNDEEITLFQLNEVPKLYEAFGDNDRFEELYEKYENKRSLTKKKIKARDLMNHFLIERIETGRIYLQNIDHANSHSAFVDKINMSNLCTEVNLPTSPIYDVNSDEGEIALCVLAAFNLGKVKTLKDLERTAYQVVYLLNKVIDMQDYVVKAAEKMLKRRSIGVGVTNFAYYLAKNGLSYDSPETPAFVDELFEHIQFYLLKASMEQAKLYGKCEYFDRTKYGQGQLPIDHYNKNVDKIVDREYTLDWEWLREQIALYGLRNSTLTCQMPCESSSVVSNSTNGIEAIRKLITMKQSKAGNPLPLVVPEITKLKNKYTKAWTFDNGVMNNIVAIIQKWMDQGISVNHYYNKNIFDNGEIPLSLIAKDILQFYQLGGKQLYYSNSVDNSVTLKDAEKQEDLEQQEHELELAAMDDGCESGACAI